MVQKGFTCRKPIELLTHSDIELIHSKSLEILQETGVVFQWEPALKILQKTGCNVNLTSQLVKFPTGIVEAALTECPNIVHVKARDPKYDLEIGGETVYFVPQATPFIYDLDTGEKRIGTIKDIDEITILQDALENIHAVFTSLEVLSDVPENVQMEWMLAEQIRHTTKATNGLGFTFCARWHIEIAKTAGIELVGAFTCSPPLTYPADQCDGLMRFAEAGFGSMMCPGVASGATGPATLAGTLLQQNVEVLAGLVLAQAVNPGIGYMFSTEAMPMDMRHGHEAIGIEQYMLASTNAQIARFYHVPSASFDSFTGGKLATDQQVGYEKAMASLLQAQAGVNYIIGAGGIDDEGCYSMEQLLIDNEMYGMIARFLRGITVNEETLAADIIKKVGPIPGNYLREAHTKKWWKQEQYLPSLSYRLSYEEWLQDGRKDVAARAKEKSREILKTHRVAPLSEDVNREISRILLAAEREKS